MSNLHDSRPEAVDVPAAPAATNPEQAHTKEPRDTAAGCRERAAADLTAAISTSTQNGRMVFEKSAASWTKRADMLHRIESGIEARLNATAGGLPEPTEAERAEDVAAARP